jgi:hypothetical protein
MNAAALFISSFVAGAVIAGAVVAIAAECQARRHAPLDLARNWREGRDFGFRDGYRRGWTAGRAEMVGEELAKIHHPTQHPLAQALNVIDLESRRIQKEQG